MTYIKFINLMCVLIYTSHQSGTVSSISLVSGPEDAHVAIGTDVILKCGEITYINFNTIHWVKYVGTNTIIISTNQAIGQESYGRFAIVPGSYNLNISNVQPSDSGEYECLYDNGRFNRFDPRANATLNVNPQSVGLHCLIVRDDVQLISKTQFVYVGESIIFHCSSKGHGNTPPILNITKSDVDVPEYISKDVLDQKVESKELIEKNDTELRCSAKSEALDKPLVCEIKLIALFPVVAIEPKSTSVGLLESTNVSFQCSGSSFRTDDLSYEWQILPDIPGEVVNFTSSTLKITDLGKNIQSGIEKLYKVTCFVKEGQMVWNASSSLSLSAALPKQSSKDEQEMSIIVPLIISPIAAVLVLCAVFLLIRYRKKHTQLTSNSPIYGSADDHTECKHLPKPCESKVNDYREPIIMSGDSATFCKNQLNNIDEESSNHYDVIGQANVYTDPIYENNAIGRQNRRKLSGVN